MNDQRMGSNVTRMILRVLLAVLLASPAAWGQNGPGSPSWDEPYTDADVTGEHVIAFWRFDTNDPTADASGNGHTLTLRGDAKFIEQGRFGGGLEALPGHPPEDKANAAVAAHHADLVPKGAFTIEMWIRPKPEFPERNMSFLIDKKYIHYSHEQERFNRDYMLIIRRAGQRHRLQAHLGFGQDSQIYNSSLLDIVPGQDYHVAFTYDAAGTGTFYLNGQQVGQEHYEGRGPISPGRRDVFIGSRNGSHYMGFAGYIDEVRLSNVAWQFRTNQVTLEQDRSRSVFRRLEDARVTMVVTNERGQPLKNARLVFVGDQALSQQVSLPDLAPGQSHQVEHTIDTRLAAGQYDLQVRVEQAGRDRPLAKMPLAITIVNRPVPNQMPVVMWGGGSLDKLKEIGFTHSLRWLNDYKRIWDAQDVTEAQSPAKVEESRQMLDQLLAADLKALAYAYPGRWVGRTFAEEYQRVDREGNMAGRQGNVCARHQRIRDYSYHVGASIGRSFGDMPAFDGALVHSEVRDGTEVCFHEECQAAFREHAGFDVPAEVTAKRGLLYRNVEDFPEDRVIPDDHPLLTYYRWFWDRGDGWNDLHTLMHQGLKQESGRDDIWTFFDPAVRAPSLYGSGGQVNYLSQWTYTYPDPVKIGLATDQLFAMAGGQPGQGVMKMTQVIWYRSQTAPAPREGQAPAYTPVAWEQEIPDARYITIAPDHLREALWLKIARPIRGIMYHGWGSLVDGSTHGSYRFTHPGAAEALTELTETVIRPLGPTLLQVPDIASDVAYLESFTSEMFAGRGSYGWGRGWGADAYGILRWAQLQPQVVYEQTIQQEGLDQYKVLVLMHCDVLPQSVVDAIHDFQDRGGIVVADQHLAPAIVPDILLGSYSRTGAADKDKAAMQALAAELREQLDSHYARLSDASDPDVITRVRRYGQTDYLFTVNDRRTFGSYVGHHGRVMEQGLPQTATVVLAREQGAVYDLTTSQQVTAVSKTGGKLAWNVELGPGGGRLFMITPRPIGSIELQASSSARRGESVRVLVRVLDDRGQEVPAVVPVQMQVLDPAGQPGEFTGYYGAADGKVEVTLDLPTNAVAGDWQIIVNDLASGQSATRTIRVR